MATAVVRFTALTAAVGVSTERLSGFTSAAIKALPVLEEMGVKMRAIASAGDHVLQVVGIATGHPTSQPGQQTNQYSQEQAVVSKLADLELRIKRVFGDNNFFAAVIQQRIDLINSGKQSAADAVAYIRQYFAAYSGGLMQDAMSSDPATRALAQELERLIASGIFA